MSCGAETEANTLLAALLAGEDVTLPDIDFGNLELPDDVTANLEGVVRRITNDELTETTIDGSGTFDVLMRGFKAHLREEFDKNRITGPEYTKAYVALVQGAMANATQFLLGRDLAFWQAQQAQLAAFTAKAQFEIAKMQLATAKFEALTAKSTYGLTKMKIASESMAYCTTKFQLEQLLPQQKLLLVEQTEAQRAQTANTRTDGATIAGLLGKQKDLYTQQITSYQRDAEVKAAKFWTDMWTTMKAIDEGLEPPTIVANANINTVLQRIQTNNGLT